MCGGRVDLDEIARQSGVERRQLAPDRARLEPLVEDGIVETDGVRFQVPESHWSLLRLAAAAFDSYLDAGADRHSRAV
jgi:oxygen-independent coproporphyrinogen-3 oxidase